MHDHICLARRPLDCDQGAALQFHVQDLQLSRTRWVSKCRVALRPWPCCRSAPQWKTPAGHAVAVAGRAGDPSRSLLALGFLLKGLSEIGNSPNTNAQLT